jgi:carbamoyltransferase
MYILGISGGFRLGYQDAAAVLIQDGNVIAAIEEERLSRIKHAPSIVPYYAIKEVLQIAGITIEQVDEIAAHGSTWGPQYQTDVKEYFTSHFGFCPKLSFWHHHMAHAAGSFFSSGFDHSMILTIDNSGDGVSTQLAVGKSQSIEVIEQYKRPQSLGIFYSALTQFCGFKKESDEYKLMGLAAYAKKDAYHLGDFLSIDKNGRYQINDAYIFPFEPGKPQPSQQQLLYSGKLQELTGIEPRVPGTPIKEEYIELAGAAQKKFEEALIATVRFLHSKTQLRKLCLSGGAALNCVANGKLLQLDFIDEIFVQPASSDAGIAMGCAQLATAAHNIRPNKVTTAYLGRKFDNEAIGKFLNLAGIKYKEIENPAKEAAQYLVQEKVIGWFQGAAEFGPRALGNRSIIASAAKKEMTDRINLKIKFRESFRPFCPSVLEEDCLLYFNLKADSAPYMTLTCEGTPLALTKVPAAIHADGTARIQTVSRESNEPFYNLLTEYKALSGTGVLLNTSFNRNHEPIADSPSDAVSAFFGSGLDALFIGNYLILK